MAATLDTVPGTWTLWVRMKGHPATAAYQATFAGSPGAREGTVTLASDTEVYTGTWQEDDRKLDEKVTFQIKGLERAGKEVDFKGYLVGLAMGGYAPGWFGPVDADGAWSGYKTAD